MMNAWEVPGRQSLIWIENRRGSFAAHPIANAPTSLVSVSLGDLDGDRHADIVAGSMYIVPGRHRVGRVTCWRGSAVAQAR
jgi:hypothetical protein